MMLVEICFHLAKSDMWGISEEMILGSRLLEVEEINSLGRGFSYCHIDDVPWKVCNSPEGDRLEGFNFKP